MWGHRLEWDLKSNRRELFAPKKDISEAKDLAKAEPERVKALQKKAEDLLGDGWLATEDGTVSFSGAYGLHHGRKHKKLDVKAGEAFQILPYDAQVFFTPQSSSQTKQGPFAQIGSTSPSKDSDLELLGAQDTTKVEIDEATSQMLEQLGYMQGDSEE